MNQYFDMNSSFLVGLVKFDFSDRKKTFTSYLHFFTSISNFIQLREIRNIVTSEKTDIKAEFLQADGIEPDVNNLATVIPVMEIFFAYLKHLENF